MKNFTTKNEFVSYELAKRLKNIGFNERCCKSYSRKVQNVGDIKLSDDICIHDWNGLNKKDIYSAPTFQQVIDWCWHKHNKLVHIAFQPVAIEMGHSDLLGYTITDKNYDEKEKYNQEGYEKSLKKAIEEAIAVIESQCIDGIKKI